MEISIQKYESRYSITIDGSQDNREIMYSFI